MPITTPDDRRSSNPARSRAATATAADRRRSDGPAPQPRAGRLDLAALPAPVDGALQVVAWDDPQVEAVGHDPRSSYVELFWLGILGPSSTLLLRRLGAGLVHSPDGFRLPVADTALGMGLGVPVGRNSPFIRALHRCCQFRLARWDDEVLAVRRKIPPLRPGQVKRLPASLQHAHAAQLEREVQSRRTAVPTVDA